MTVVGVGVCAVKGGQAVGDVKGVLTMDDTPWIMLSWVRRLPTES